MMPTMKKMEITLERTIPATPAEVYDAWLDPENPVSPWNGIDRLILDLKVDGLFYRMHLGDKGEELPHFGRFTALERPRRIEHTWMSPFTRGLESVVAVTLAPRGENTLLTLRHTGLPDDDLGRLHVAGWTHYLDRFLVRREEGAASDAALGA